jgi:diguanylate cyclase (GGDEF)-like protein
LLRLLDHKIIGIGITKVNDRYGHIAGDEILLTFAKNELLFRFGGEEFVILLAEMATSGAQRLLNKFKDFICDTKFPLAGRITVSLGFARITSHDYPPIVLYH